MCLGGFLFIRDHYAREHVALLRDLLYLYRNKMKEWHSFSFSQPHKSSICRYGTDSISVDIFIVTVIIVYHETAAHPQVTAEPESLFHERGVR